MDVEETVRSEKQKQNKNNIWNANPLHSHLLWIDLTFFLISKLSKEENVNLLTVDRGIQGFTRSTMAVR